MIVTHAGSFNRNADHRRKEEFAAADMFARQRHQRAHQRHI